MVKQQNLTKLKLNQMVAFIETSTFDQNLLSAPVEEVSLKEGPCSCKGFSHNLFEAAGLKNCFPCCIRFLNEARQKDLA